MKEIVIKGNHSVSSRWHLFRIMDTKKANCMVNDLYFTLEYLITKNIFTIIVNIILDQIPSNLELIHIKLISVLDNATGP